jgi:hypothetical protein
MLTYLPFLLLQPWKALSRRQRRYVWRQCIHPFTTRWPIMLAKSLLLFAALMATVLPDVLHGWKLYFAWFVIVFFTTDVFDMILVARGRSRVVEYIREHRQEIQAVV